MRIVVVIMILLMMILLMMILLMILLMQALEPEYRKVISSITMKMGQGMAEFAVKTQSIDTIANYNLYWYALR